MSKEIDRASEHEMLMREQQIKAVTNRAVSTSAFECEDCDKPIPEQRRIASMGCTRCIDCQTIFELKSKHYRSV
ncbi:MULTISPECIES: TraR/DksA family transcriptional regulator [Providencia]|uniref:Phage/conjugal plasmid C-4 type zinc finger protein, TraR family n=1 Tax=Providencia rustigianii DSM 4541 TaxID=500637 RepID=D1P4V0_9GAMM|nr:MULTISPECIES: TraR/DksA family transcriptional regulator [Providencia]EFB71514.1 phage/conjugal plasmid C-4 type zinc finger protein, TraR family [Providencia rustigianii DSM 4541]MBG5882300.1 TraR/DksA family transcriptional regulator [Providencia alcalifaciens]MTC47900.1 TraR/DksA family transcriptional regulator [Providencia sp. wls1922]SUC27213.1 DnaK suppressor protein [Providencia rustigianii]